MEYQHDLDSRVSEEELATQLARFLQLENPQELEADELIQLVVTNGSLAELPLTQHQLTRLCRLSVHSVEWLGLLLHYLTETPLTPNYISLFKHSSMRFKVPNNKLHTSFTIQLWFQTICGGNGANLNNNSHTNDNVNCLTANTLVDIKNILSLQISNNKLVMKIHTSTEANIIFDSFFFDPNTLYHLVVMHTATKNGGKFNLYVDGEFIQSIPVSNVVEALDRSSNLEIELGNKELSCCESLNIINLMLLNYAQPLEWILLSYYLGPNYSGRYLDGRLTESLSYRARNLFELKLKESYIHTNLYGKGSNRSNGGHKFEEFSRQELLKFEQIYAMLLKSGKLNLDPESILFHLHARNINSTVVNSRSSGAEYHGGVLTCEGELSIHQSLPAHSVLYAIGGITIALKIVESSSCNDQLCLGLNLLFELISKDWRSLKEFEMRNGYDLIATLLKTKKQMIDLKVLDIILKFIGYDHNSPIDSVMINPFAYRSFILDFDIWNSNLNKESKETFKFLLFQFTVFFQESKYSLYNINKLVKMKVIKRFIQALKSEAFGKDILPVVYDSLLILIKANPSSEIMKSLSLYIVYALNKEKKPIVNDEPLQRLCGMCALELLVSFICDSSLINSTLSSAVAVAAASSSSKGSNGSAPMNIATFYKKLARTISVRWILVLLDDPNLKVVKPALRLLIRMLSLAGPKYYTHFMRHNGLEILTSLLEKWWESDFEIIVIIFSGAFGISQTHDLGSDLIQFADRLSKRGSRLNIAMPEFLYLVTNLIHHGIKTVGSFKALDPIHEDLCFNLASCLNAFIGCFELTYQNVPCLNKFYCSDFTWISGYLRLMNELQLLPSESSSQDILASQELLNDKFSNLTIELLFKESVGEVNFPLFIKLFSKNPKEMTILQQLVFPKILEHLISFQDMLPELFSSQTWLKNNIFTFIKSFSYSVENISHDDKLYFDFSKVMDILFKINQSKNISSDLAKLRNIAGDCFVKEYLSLSEESYLKELTKELVFKQDLYFHPNSMDTKKLAGLISNIYKNCEIYEDEELYSISINALRMIIIYRHDDLSKIIDSISARGKSKLNTFFETLLSSNDNDIIEIIKEKSLSGVFKRNGGLEAEQRLSLLQISDSWEPISESKAVQAFDEDNLKWKQVICSSETAKFFRHIQDHEDNLQFYISVYNKMRQEAARLLFGVELQDFKWVVDSIECDSRMRRRLVPEFSFTSYDVNSLAVESSPSESAISATTSRGTPEPQSMASLTRSASITSIELEESFEMIEDPGESEAIQEDKNRKVLRSLYLGDKIVDLWNISQILGLESVESIFILGNTHLYIMENYFHASNGEILDIDDAPQQERDPYMQLILGPKQKVALETKNNHAKKNKGTKTWELEKLTSVSKRQFLLRDVALEFFFTDGSSFLITCINPKIRDAIYSKLSGLATGKIADQDLSQALSLSTSSSSLSGNGAPTIFGFNFSNAFSNNAISSSSTTKKWQRGEISNFYYLMIINTLAGRTFNDLTQYPVFPWVIADYTSEELDLSDPKSFRDLTKPMGGQGSQREATFIERYEALASLQDPDAPPFHYGTHYSSAMIVTQYLIRLEPYVQSYLLLQGGRFDHADRLFYSISKAWHSASQENTTDVRELIPEFFYLPEFLENKNNFDLGKLQDGQIVSDVILPPWAKGDPKIFIQKNREALESPYVSSHLQEWIDLVFGYKQSGQAAIDATNVFHHLSYNGAIDLDKIEDEVERRAMTGIIHNFGQTPLQIFTKPHPPRDDLHFAKVKLDYIPDKPFSVRDSKSGSPVKYIDLGSKDKQWRGRPKVFSNEDGVHIRSFDDVGSLIIDNKVYEELHSSKINVLIPFGRRMFLTGSEEGTIHVWKYIMRTNFPRSNNITVGRRETMSSILELKHDSFEFQAVLRGHLNAVLDIQIAPAFNSALSLDSEGRVFLWDLVRFSLIREISTDTLGIDVEAIAIANDTGYILLSGGSSLAVLTLNGELIIKTNLHELGEPFGPVCSAQFAQQNWILPKHGAVVNHEYWQKTSMIVLGCKNRVEIISLGTEDGIWNIKKLRVFKIDSESGDRNIVAVKMMLSNESNTEGGKSGKSEIIAGDDKGRIIVWK